jgi:hypothetical protein
VDDSVLRFSTSPDRRILVVSDEGLEMASDLTLDEAKYLVRRLATMVYPRAAIARLDDLEPLADKVQTRTVAARCNELLAIVKQMAGAEGG